MMQLVQLTYPCTCTSWNLQGSLENLELNCSFQLVIRFGINSIAFWLFLALFAGIVLEVVRFCLAPSGQYAWGDAFLSCRI